MEKEKDDPHEMQILNFQAMTETQDREVSINYLRQNEWDESVVLPITSREP
jgi:hypothetical protein